MESKATAYKVDISDDKQVQDFADKARDEYGRVDVIFNNAGVDNGAGRIHEYPVEVFDKIMAVDMRYILSNQILITVNDGTRRFYY